MGRANNKGNNESQVTSNESKEKNPLLVARYSSLVTGRITRYSLLLVKLLVSSLLLYFLVSKVGGRTLIENMLLLNPYAFAAAVGLYLFAAYLSTLRWKLLIPEEISTGRLFSLYMIGSFFNTYMPGAVGGDVVKAYYMSRELKGRTSGSPLPGASEAVLLSNPLQKHDADHNVIAVASVFMDRYIGFFALLVVGTVAFPFGMRYLEGASIQWPVIWIVPFFLAAFFVSSLILFKFRLGARVKFLFKIYDYFQLYSSRRDVLVPAFLYSLLVQILGVLSIYILSNGLSMGVAFLPFLIFVPIIILVSFLPLSISGIGLREGAFVLLLGSIGVPPKMSMTLSIAWFLSVFVAGIWGLVEYLRFKAVFGGKIE